MQAATRSDPIDPRLLNQDRPEDWPKRTSGAEGAWRLHERDQTIASLHSRHTVPSQRTLRWEHAAGSEPRPLVRL